MSLVSIAVQAAITIGILMVMLAIVETLRRLGVDPVGKIAGFLSQRDAAGNPVVRTETASAAMTRGRLMVVR